MPDKELKNQLHNLQVLKDEQKRAKESLGASSKQVKLWGDLEKLFDCKMKCMENAGRGDQDGSVIHRERGTETLVL